MRMTDAPSHVDESPEQSPESTPDAASERPESALDSDRYAQLSLDDGELVIYDRTEPETWVQSDVFVDVGV